MASCKDDKGKDEPDGPNNPPTPTTKRAQLKTVTDDDGDEAARFTWNSDGEISSVANWDDWTLQFRYSPISIKSNGQALDIEKDNKGRITYIDFDDDDNYPLKEYYSYNSAGQLIECEYRVGSYRGSIEYEWKNGGIVSCKYGSNDYNDEYIITNKQDNKYGIITSYIIDCMDLGIGWGYMTGLFGVLPTKLPTEIEHYDNGSFCHSVTIKYRTDEDGRITRETVEWDDGDEEIYYYKYNSTDDAPVKQAVKSSKKKCHCPKEAQRRARRMKK